MAKNAPSAALSAHRSRGRPREFDMNAALDKAIQVFSRRGFHATSIPDLAVAMGLTSGSIYKAFKDKRAVFIAAFDRQSSMRSAQLRAAIATKTSGQEKLRQALLFYANLSHGVDGQDGCLVCSTAIELATFDTEIGARAVGVLRRWEAQLRDLILEGQADGSVDPKLDPKDTAKFMLCLLQGLRVVGKTGPSRAAMVAAAQVAMRVVG